MTITFRRIVASLSSLVLVTLGLATVGTGLLLTPGIAAADGSCNAPTPQAGGAFAVICEAGAGSWTVPSGVTSAQFQVSGGAGGPATDGGNASGDGGSVVGNLTVSAGQVYAVTVGSDGLPGTDGQGGTGGAGAAPGGDGGSIPTDCVTTHSCHSGGGGGGASSVVLNGTTLQFAAGGGGGAGTAASGSGSAGTGSGSADQAGGPGIGGSGGTATGTASAGSISQDGSGGGGGGGFGGGQGSPNSTGGGGGAGFAVGTATGVILGLNQGSGLVDIIYTPAPVPPTITTAFATPTVPINGATTLTYTITNPNGISATGINFSDVLPPGLSVTSGTPGGTCTGASATTGLASTVTLSGLTVTAGASCTITVPMTATTLGDQNEAVTLHSDISGTSTANASINVFTPTVLSFQVSGSQTYGSSSPTFTPALVGGGSLPSGVTLNGTATCTTVNGGTPIAPTLPTTGPNVLDSSSCAGLSLGGANAPNYVIGLTDGAFVINPAALTVTASSPPDMTFGSTPPAITPSYSAFQNSDTPDSLTTPPACTTTATSTSDVGMYPTSCSGAVDNNYIFTYVPGSLTVGVASQTITFTSAVPTNAFVGGPTYTVAASGGASGEPVTLTSTTPTICTLSGTTVTPVAVGICTILANQAGNSNFTAAPAATQSFTVVLPPLVITTASPLPQATIGTPYSVTLAATGGNGGPYTWTLASGTLPAGLTLSPGGVISGTPSAAGTATFTVSVGDPTTGTFTLTVAPVATAAAASLLAFTGANLLPIFGGGGTLIGLGALLLAALAALRRKRST
jgi:trimeric autotransporter adhesin